MPPINISVYPYYRQVDGPTIAQTRDRFTEAQLRATIGQWLVARPTPRHFQLHTPHFDLQSYIDKYSEQTMADPIQDLRKFFAASPMIGRTVGGIDTEGT